MRSINRTIFLESMYPILKKQETCSEEERQELKNGYAYRCSTSLSELLRAEEKTHISLTYILNNKELEPPASRYSIADLIQFTVENFLIRCNAIYDRALQLVNSFLDLGMDKQQVSHEKIITNRHVLSNNNLKGSLKSLKKATTEYQLERNKIIHHGTYDDPEFLRVQLMHDINQTQQKIGEPPLVCPNEVSKKTAIYIDKKTDSYKKHMVKVTDKLDDFLLQAESIFKEKRQVLEKI